MSRKQLDAELHGLGRTKKVSLSPYVAIEITLTISNQMVVLKNVRQRKGSSIRLSTDFEKRGAYKR